MNQQTKAFTLVELIVVIVILAILWTIAFIAMQWYSRDSRDSVRISDISTMKTTLELFHLEAWKYPLSTNSFTVTYSGSDVWNQGTYWSSVFTNVSSINKIPTDPLTDKPYTYSVTTKRNEYQLAWIIEAGEIAIFSDTYAWDTEATALVSWNYNGAILKTITWSTCEMLSVPTIISSEEETTTDLVDILSTESLVYDGYNNLPTNYRDTKYKADGGFGFTSNQLVVYSDDNECNTLTENTTEWTEARNTLVTNTQTAYLWTIIQSQDSVSFYTSVDLNDTKEVASLGGSIINNYFGWDGKVELTSNAINGVCWTSHGGNFTSEPSTNLCEAWNLWWTWIVDNWAWSTFTWECEWIAWWTADSCSASHDLSWFMLLDAKCDQSDVHIPAWCTEWTAGCQIWAGCNSTLWTWAEYLVYSSNWSVCYWYWNGAVCDHNASKNSLLTHEKRTSVWFTWWVTTPYGDQEFDVIWWKLYAFSDANSNACPSWRHLPSDAEWTQAENTLYWSTCRTSKSVQCPGLWWRWDWDNNNRKLAYALKIPLWWHIYSQFSIYSEARWQRARLWTSTNSWWHGDYNVYRWFDRSTNTVESADMHYSIKMSVRCLKNTSM